MNSGSKRQALVMDISKARKERDHARKCELESIKRMETDPEYKEFWADSVTSWRNIGDFWASQAVSLDGALRRQFPITIALENRISPAIHAVDFDRVED